MDIDECDLYTAGAEGQDAGPSLDDMMHLNLYQPHLLSEEDIYTARDEMPQPSAPLDIAKFKIKVDWTEPFPERWRARLQKALQSWVSRLEGKPSVHSVKLMDDQTCAEVQITPSTALKVLKCHRTASLHFKNIKDDKEVTAQIYLDEAHPVTVQKTLLEENKAPSSKVNSTRPVTSAVSEDTDDSEDVVAANRASKDAESTQTFKRTPETSAGLTVPLYHFWYILHAYRKEVEKLEEQHGVSMQAEVSVSFRSTERSSSDSVSKASEDFQKLVSDCVVNCSEAAVNHNDMNLDIATQAIRTIQSEEAKLMLTMSASNGQFFGPNKITDMIKRETTRVEQPFKYKSNEMDVDNNVSRQRRFSLEMDTKELPTQLEMSKVHWDLMNLSCKEHLSQLKTKYGVFFNEETLHKNVIKVQARSKGVQHINLESHALRALTQLYQKLASSTVSCKLTNPTDATIVAPLLEKLQQQHRVVAADEPWRLAGLPEHLGPAISYIEKTLQKNVFDDKMKKSIGYAGDIPHARDINWKQMPNYGPGAVGGAEWDERVNFRGQDEIRFYT
ncbi:uncharacterized protein LOC113054964 [Carassius auratus]|uniref:Uncharacterized protein LOC113054964 n=1 Tax=Carassius auratus TaxID=7957 RepID=A0A6P6KYU2_CARAU|nr:uncharacterized protein LOC113054964 [Carassius auratus]